MAILILVFVTAFAVVLYSTPALIKVAVLKRLIDLPTEDRKVHKRAVPTIGGIIIYAATLFSFSLWYNIDDLHEYDQIYESVKEFKILVATSLVLFFVGVKDDGYDEANHSEVADDGGRLVFIGYGRWWCG